MSTSFAAEDIAPISSVAVVTTVSHTDLHALVLQFDESMKTLMNLHAQGDYVKLSAAFDVLLDMRQRVEHLAGSTHAS